MYAMAVPLPDDSAVERHRSVRNRQCSVYASRPRPAVAPLVLDAPSAAAAPGVPQLPPLPLSPLPLSPRWDSLANGTFLRSRSPTPQPQWPSLGSALTTGDVLLTWPEPRSGPPSRTPSRTPTAQSSPTELRSPADGAFVENFSRPRKQSIRQPVAPEQRGPGPALPRRATTLHTDPLREIGPRTPPPPWQRPSRRPSASWCSLSPMTSTPTAVDSADPRAPRARNAAPMSAPRPPFAGSRPDGAPALAGGAPPWVAADELRSSFRSQMTASTGPGTAVTERSSVLTKDSSVASLYNPDEPSLEDVMGMYEKGFADDDDDYADADNGDGGYNGGNGGNGINGRNGDRDATAADAADAADAGFDDAGFDDARAGLAMGDGAWDDTDLPLPPATSAQSTLDAKIRKSKMIFTSPAFTSSVPALSGAADVDTGEKRDSGKSLDSEPSLASCPRPKTMTVASPPVSGPPSPVSSAGARPPPPPRAAAVEMEDPGSRDRYGFKKQSQYITRKQYDAWNKGYTQYLARRRTKWVAYLKDCALMTDRPMRFPPPSAKTKRFVRKGIPPDWRGAAWFYYAGGPAILAKHAGLYEKLLHKEAKAVDAEAIERDLHRTFPDNIQFQPSTGDRDGGPARVGSAASSESSSSSRSRSTTAGPAGAEGEPPMIASLRRVLHAFSVYNPRIGYCQSLNFLAGLLLLFVETEEQCFWLLNVITIIYLPGTHETSLEGSKVDLGVLMTELRDTMPGVWDRVGGELESGTAGLGPATGSKPARRAMMLRRRDQPRLSTDWLPPITLCMTAWFMSCYIGTLPMETTLRVWDVFFYEGSKTLFRVALAIFKRGEAEIKAVADPMEMFGVVQALPRRMLDANALLETCFKRRNGFGHLSQEAIDERRQERRDRARQQQQQQQQQQGVGNEAEADAVRRKGTLFGRKRREQSRPRGLE